MKRLCPIIFAAAIFAALTGCNFNISSSTGWSSSNLKASTNIVQTAAIPAGLKSLEVIIAFGTIHITGDDNNPAGWSQRLTVRARTEAEVQQIASNFLCKAESDGDHLHLKLVVTTPDLICLLDSVSGLEL